MTTFEKTWYDKYMNNVCTTTTLIKLANANKLNIIKVNEWIAERQEKLGY